MKTMTKFTITTVLFAGVFGFAAVVSAQDTPPAGSTLPPASTKTGVTYVTDIKPVFDTACVKCHNSAKKPKAGLALDSLAGILKGSRDGKVVIAGNSAKSDLVLAVAHVGDPDSFMPKGKGAKKLTDDQIGLIRAWIDQGAN
ncbi:MAG TPA: c-type cytochrome domain-containing protein [Candidatus Baltobacteraceae bacterium]|nr:c-type cytochrome domain-containing protein [Candidatus Baltobacteraceae bacterium]